MVAKQASQGQWNSKIRLCLIRSSVTAEENNIISGRNLEQEKKTQLSLSFSNHFGNYMGSNCFFPANMGLLDTF